MGRHPCPSGVRLHPPFTPLQPLICCMPWDAQPSAKDATPGSMTMTLTAYNDILCSHLGTGPTMSGHGSDGWRHMPRRAYRTHFVQLLHGLSALSMDTASFVILCACIATVCWAVNRTRASTTILTSVALALQNLLHHILLKAEVSHVAVATSEQLISTKQSGAPGGIKRSPALTQQIHEVPCLHAGTAGRHGITRLLA
jgi:hypothetical protein